MRGTVQNLRIKRAYDLALPDDGERYLVDRLWPRGARKEALKLTAWLKDVAPSTELRQWFGHQISRWKEFRRRYRTELKSKPGALQPLRGALVKGAVTLVYSARSEEHNQLFVEGARGFCEYLAHVHRIGIPH